MVCWFASFTIPYPSLGAVFREADKVPIFNSLFKILVMVIGLIGV